jgi:chloramphenicol O-acetyltransferase type A
MVAFDCESAMSYDAKNYYLCDPLSKKTAMREIDPQTTTRAYAFEMWMQAPMPMVTFFKTLDVSRLLKISRKRGLKFNMLMCYCIGRAAMQVKEFYMLPVGDKLMQYDTIAVNTIVANSAGEVSSCDLPFSEDLEQFNNDYLRLTKEVAESCSDHDLSAEGMVIGTSALALYEIDGAVGMYSGIFNNPFMIWGKYKRGLFKTTLSVSFQFHHTQMDGAHAAKFLDLLQREIGDLNA